MARRSICIHGSEKYTNRNRAKRFIKQGLAEWTDDTQTVIRFITRERILRNGPMLEVTRPAIWEPCYRNTEAPCVPVSLEWLHSVGY